MIAKTWLKSASEIKDVGAYFAVSDAKRAFPLGQPPAGHQPWLYLGYNDLRDPSVSGFFRFLAKVGDGIMKIQIVKIGF